MMAENYFEKLYAVNVNDKAEKKNGLTYLSWAWAWAEVKKQHPDATYTIYENADGLCYHTDGRTCWVKTGVTVNGIEHIEYLPVMDHRNKSIPLNAVTSFEVNKAIQRSLTKACARHGLGLYIYAGEDLPEGDDSQPESQPDLKPNPPIQGPRMATQEQIEYLTANCSEEQCMAIMNKYGADLARLTYATAEKLIDKLKGGAA